METDQVARKAELNTLRQVFETWYQTIDAGFIFQKDKLPVYDIPDIDGFELLPYVEYLAPQLDAKLSNYQQRVNK